MEHLDRLSRLIDLSGLDVVDVGAGNGAFAAALAGAGARVTGIEIEADRVEAARARHGPVAAFAQGRAEALPLAAESADLVCFMFSLHHVPADLQSAAMTEALRVLRPGGRVHIVEPDVTGDMTSVVRLIDDETEVRSRTAEFVTALVQGPDLRELVRCRYDLVRTYASFDAMAEAVVLADPARAALFGDRREAMLQRFQKVAVPVAGGFSLGQPCTAYHLMRRRAVEG